MADDSTRATAARAVRLAEIQTRYDDGPDVRTDVGWLLGEVRRLTGERDRARDLAVALEQELAAVGICGDLAPTLGGNTALPVCELRAGHDGWHEDGEGCRWSRSDVSLAGGVS